MTANWLFIGLFCTFCIWVCSYFACLWRLPLYNLLQIIDRSIPDYISFGNNVWQYVDSLCITNCNWHWRKIVVKLSLGRNAQKNSLRMKTRCYLCNKHLLLSLNLLLLPSGHFLQLGEREFHTLIPHLNTHKQTKLIKMLNSNTKPVNVTWVNVINGSGTKPFKQAARASWCWVFLFI